MEYWQEQILEGMRLIDDGCKLSQGDCIECPFQNRCQTFQEKKRLRKKMDEIRRLKRS